MKQSVCLVPQIVTGTICPCSHHFTTWAGLSSPTASSWDQDDRSYPQLLDPWTSIPRTWPRPRLCHSSSLRCRPAPALRSAPRGCASRWRPAGSSAQRRRCTGRFTWWRWNTKPRSMRPLGWWKKRGITSTWWYFLILFGSIMKYPQSEIDVQGWKNSR